MIESRKKEFVYKEDFFIPLDGFKETFFSPLTLKYFLEDLQTECLKVGIFCSALDRDV